MNTRHRITVENLKCGGCVSTIIKRVGAVESVDSVVVDMDTETVFFVAPLGAVATVHSTLRQLGYPQRGSASVVSSVAATARSYVSCAIGKVQVAS